MPDSGTDLSALRLSIRTTLTLTLGGDVTDRTDLTDAVMGDIRPVLERLEQRAEDAEVRADQVEDLLRIAHQTSNTSERARQAAVQRAEQAEQKAEYWKHKCELAWQDGDQQAGERIALHCQVSAVTRLAMRYRTAWWSARIRAAKAQGVAVRAVQIMGVAGRRAEQAEAILAKVRTLHARHECDDCNCRRCWGLIPACAAGCAEYPCPTLRALTQTPQGDPGPDRTEPDPNGPRS